MSSIEKIIEKDFAIGLRKYEQLKSYNFDTMSEEQIEAFNKVHKMTVANALKAIKQYEEKRKPINTKKAIEYLDNVKNTVDTTAKKIQKINKKWLWLRFKYFYALNERTEFIEDEKQPYLENIKALIFYFIGDEENFKKSKRVCKEYEPSKYKWLLLIGNYGNGKTSSMNALRLAIEPVKDSQFIIRSAKELVREFEYCKTPLEKQQFFKKYTEEKDLLIDDILKEKEASNYGKTNLIEDILEIRIRKNKRTYLTMNFRDENGKFIEYIEDALDLIAERYGGYLYDRIHSHFNIIHFKGKSQRK